MPIKPIDLQTSIGQLPEVGKSEHAKQGIIAEQQHLLDKQAAEKSNLVNTRLDQTEKGEKTAIRDEEKKKSGSEKEKEEREHRKKEEEGKERLKDDRMGKIIDVLK